MKAYMRIKIDRPFDMGKHYFSPGGYEVKTADGKVYGFDFNESQWGPDSEDPRVIEVKVKDEDCDSFPGIPELKDKLGEITELTEFYVYTGEEGEECVVPVELLDFIVNDSGTGYRKPPASTDFIEVCDNLDGKAKEYGSYDINYVFKEPLLEQANRIFKAAAE